MLHMVHPARRCLCIQYRMGCHFWMRMAHNTAPMAPFTSNIAPKPPTPSQPTPCGYVSTKAAYGLRWHAISRHSPSGKVRFHLLELLEAQQSHESELCHIQTHHHLCHHLQPRVDQVGPLFAFIRIIDERNGQWNRHTRFLPAQTALSLTRHRTCACRKAQRPHQEQKQ